MNFDEVARITDDMERNEALYQFFNEDERLLSRVGRVEFLTNFTAIQGLLRPQSHILDIGSGTGAYALPLAKEGHKVTAWEPASRNFALLSQKAAAQGSSLRLRQASSLDMAELPDAAYDMVLLFGPLYHLSKAAEQRYTLTQARRVCKPEGSLLISFINHDMVPMSETMYRADWFADGDYDKASLRLANRPFVFFTLEEAKALLESCGLRIERILASDGFAELLHRQLAAMSEESYTNYLRWHAAKCEQAELLGASNHWLFVCRSA